MRITLMVSKIPGSHTIVVLLGIFSTPATYGGGNPLAFYITPTFLLRSIVGLLDPLF